MLELSRLLSKVTHHQTEEIWMLSDKDVILMAYSKVQVSPNS